MSPEKTRCRDDGTVHIGRDDADVDTIATAPDVAKASVRDLAIVVARGAHAATTVAATSHLAAQAGIAVFATGGLGGVHRDASSTFDESADLTTLSRNAITVVCAGVKSILDRSEEHTSELQSLMRISYAVFCLKKQHISKKQ